VQPDRIPRVDQVGVGIEKPDLALFALDIGFHRLAVQQAVDDTYIFLHVSQLHCPEPHCSAGGKAGADAEVDATGGHPVQRGKSVGGDGRDAIGWYQHAGAKPDAAGLHRRGAHRDEAVGGDHLRVVEPGMGEAQFLGALCKFP
jgi:hypothetical protein